MTQIEISEQLLQRAGVIKKLRREKKISKIAASEATGLSRKTIDTMESGDRGWGVTCEIIYTTFLNSLPSKITK